MSNSLQLNIYETCFRTRALQCETCNVEDITLTIEEDAEDDVLEEIIRTLVNIMTSGKTKLTKLDLSTNLSADFESLSEESQSLLKDAFLHPLNNITDISVHDPHAAKLILEAMSQPQSRITAFDYSPDSEELYEERDEPVMSALVEALVQPESRVNTLSLSLVPIDDEFWSMLCHENCRVTHLTLVKPFFITENPMERLGQVLIRGLEGLELAFVELDDISCDRLAEVFTVNEFPRLRSLRFSELRGDKIHSIFQALVESKRMVNTLHLGNSNYDVIQAAIKLVEMGLVCDFRIGGLEAFEGQPSVAMQAALQSQNCRLHELFIEGQLPASGANICQALIMYLARQHCPMRGLQMPGVILEDDVASQLLMAAKKSMITELACRATSERQQSELTWFSKVLQSKWYDLIILVLLLATKGLDGVNSKNVKLMMYLPADVVRKHIAPALCTW